MNPQEAHDKIREVCSRRKDLAFKDYLWPPPQETVDRTELKPFQGHCYIASHVFAMLVKDATVHTDENGAHYWNMLDGEVWDLTKEQFDYEFNYSDSYKVKRKTKPTERMRALLEELET